MRLGPGWEDSTDVGPVINGKALEKIHSYTEIGTGEGATLLTGGEAATDGDLGKGFYYRPTIFGDVDPQMRVAQEEIFGPTTSLIRVRDFDEAIRVQPYYALAFDNRGFAYFVLGRAARYPTGSVTTISAASLPTGRASYQDGLYLIHAPRAFYVIDKVFQRPVKPFTKCTVAFDRERFQFYCPGTRLRWNRIGQPLRAHARQASDWALGLHVATVAQDGHVLFNQFFGAVLPAAIKRRKDLAPLVGLLTTSHKECIEERFDSALVRGALALVDAQRDGSSSR